MSNRAAPKFDSALRAAVAPLAACVAQAFPQACALCGAPSGAALVCAPCVQALPALPPACPVCALPSPGALRCGRCLAHPPPLSATVAACVYAFPLDRLVQELKYAHRLALAWPLAERLAAAVLGRPSPQALPQALVPMPLSRTRQRERGFNQAAEIARVVARRTRVPVCHALARPGERAAQATLPWRARRRNVRGAFAAVAPLAGRHVALVDDVMTTGATLEAAARALLGAGAARVDAWVVARTLPPGG